MPPPHETIGRYRIVSELGRGAMGIVYRADDTLIGRVVALKVVPRPGARSTPQEHEIFSRFLREARASGTLLHPNVVLIFDVGEDAQAGVSYIAMEYIDGEPLDRALNRGRRFEAAEVRAIGIQVAAALETAHEAGIIHRDIKPANLLLTRSGVVKVTDFGIAKIVADAAMTQDGMILGSPSYMSPEQLRAAVVDRRSDVFSLGVVLYELATGRPAFPGKNLMEVIARLSKGDVVAPRELRPEIPEDLEWVILRALEPDRERRFPTAAALAAALGSGGKEPPLVSAPPVAAVDPALTAAASPANVGRADSPALAARARGRRAWLVAAALAVAIAGLAVGILRAGRGEGPATTADPDPAAVLAAGVGLGAAATATPTPAAPRVRVRHDHAIGSCRGSLRLHPDRLVYDAAEGGGDDRTWSYGSLREVRVARDEVSFAAPEAGESRRWRFRPEGDGFSATALRELRARLAG